MKKVSIIIPAYNAEKYLEKCVKSIINQTYKNIEIIIINDGSKDNTEKVIFNFAFKDNRIKVINRENKGVQYSRKEGIQKSEGEFIFFVDADDWIEDDTIEKLIEYQSRYDADIVKSSYILEDERGGIEKKYKYTEAKNICIRTENYKEYLFPDIIDTYIYNNMWGQLIRKSIINIDKIKTNIAFGEDYIFNLEIYENSKAVVRLKDCFYHYRVNQKGIVMSDDYMCQIRKIEDSIIVYEELNKAIKRWNIDTEKNREKIAIKQLNEVTNILITICHHKNDDLENVVYKIVSNNAIKKMCNEKDIFKQKKLKNKKIVKKIKRKNIKIIILLSKVKYFKVKMKKVMKSIIFNKWKGAKNG